jgi:hypothetical protein
MIQVMDFSGIAWWDDIPICQCCMIHYIAKILLLMSLCRLLLFNHKTADGSPLWDVRQHVASTSSLIAADNRIVLETRRVTAQFKRPNAPSLFP